MRNVFNLPTAVMILFGGFLLIGIILLTACTASPSPFATISPSQTLPVRVSPTQRMTPFPTEIPTATNTLEPTQTSTFTPTPTPNPTPIYPELNSLVTSSSVHSIDSQRWLVFSYYAGGYYDENGEIYIIRLDGTGRRNLTNNPADDVYPQWSHDGRKIAFLSDRFGQFCVGIPAPGCSMDIFTMNSDGNDLARISHNLMTNDFAWSPDNQQIAYMHFSPNNSYDGFGTNIYIVNRDGTQIRNITNRPKDYGEYYFDVDIAWRPDGKQIMFASTYKQGLYIYNISTKETLFYSQGSGEYTHPQWSPDGNQISFTFTNDTGDSSKNGIYIMNSDFSHRVLVAQDDFPAFPKWSPDGKWIVYGHIFGHPISINLINTTTMKTTQILNSNGAWRSNKIIWTSHSKQLIFPAAEQEFNQYDLYIINIDGSGLTNITNTPGDENDPSLRP